MDTKRNPRNWKHPAVLGYGREGRAAVEYLTKRVGIAPESIAVLDTGLSDRPAGLDPRIEFLGGTDAFADLSSYDAIVKSPGIPPAALPHPADYERSVTLAQMFFDLHPERVIAVSGTKGKSTLSTLLTRVISDAGYRCDFYGNIGTPVLPAYDPADPPDYIVIELSSYMLDRLEKKNFASVLLNIFPDHQDWHGGTEPYAQAKMRLIG
jgi:UDP-N-acetylmuramoyl-L-alanine---L-glutamate ligase